MLRRRLLTHIGEELLKAVSPLIADSNATRSVSLIVDSTGVVASLFHLLPRLVFSGLCKPVGGVEVFWRRCFASASLAFSRLDRPANVFAGVLARPPF